MCECYRGGIVVMEGCDLPLILCKYHLRNGGLFVLSWTMVRRVNWGSISS